MGVRCSRGASASMTGPNTQHQARSASCLPPLRRPLRLPSRRPPACCRADYCTRQPSLPAPVPAPAMRLVFEVFPPTSASRRVATDNGRRPRDPARRRHPRRHQPKFNFSFPSRPSSAPTATCFAPSPTAGRTAGEVPRPDVVSLPVKVKQAKVDRPISFKLDVMPVFMQAGCNVGGCHGAARGKDGFRLSLFGFDPDGDYHRLTRELATAASTSPSRRKPAADQGHRQGPPHRRHALQGRQPLYNTLLRWLEAGAPQDPPTVANAGLDRDSAAADRARRRRRRRSS